MQTCIGERAAPCGNTGWEMTGRRTALREITGAQNAKHEQNLFHREDTAGAPLSNPACPGAEAGWTEASGTLLPSACDPAGADLPASPGRALCCPSRTTEHLPRARNLSLERERTGMTGTDRTAGPARPYCGLPRPCPCLPRPPALAPPRMCPAVPRKAALTQAQRARGAGGTMASGKERLDRAQVSRGAGRGLPKRCRGLRGVNQALPERGQAGFDPRLCHCGAVAGEEGGGGSRGFYQKEKQGRRAAPQRGRERPSPGDGVEGPAGGKSHQNVRHRYAAAWLLGLLVSLGLEKSAWPILSLRGLAAAALSWERPCRARRQLYPPLGTARSWAVPALCTEHTDSAGCQLQGIAFQSFSLRK